MERVAMHAEPAVTAVVTTHNRAHLVGRAIASALAQSHPPLEVIVVDDASTDGTEAVVRAFGGRVRYLRHDRPRGGAAARNTGIDNARGRYVAFLDDDDVWEVEKTARQLPLHDRCQVSVCGVRRASDGSQDLRFPSHAVDAAELRRGFVFAGGASNLMADTGFAQQIRFDDSLVCGQDWDFVLRAAIEGRVEYVAEPLVRYNDAVHARITNQPLRLDRDGLERRMAVVYKHAAFLGAYWTAFHRADRLLSHVAQRSGRLRHLEAALAECGWRATAGVLAHKLRRGMRRRFARLRPA